MSAPKSNFDPQVIANIPPDLLKTLPAGQPPPGLSSNFAHPPTRVPVILGISTTFLVVAVFCFIIRIYTKSFVSKRWKWDDLTCSLGFACSLVHYAFVFNGCINGAAGRHGWDISLYRVLHEASLLQNYVTVITITPALGLIKCSLFIQYYQLFRILRWIRVSVWVGATVAGLFYTAVSITAFILQSPWPGESLLDDTFSKHYLRFANVSIPVGVIGMLVDWYLLILPIPAVLTLQMSIAKKVGVLVVFMTGGLAVIASTVSLYYRVRLQSHYSDVTWEVGYVLLWAQVEMFAGVAAASMPTVHQFFTRHTFRVPSWASSPKASFTNLLRIRSSRTHERLSEDKPGLTNWSAVQARAVTNGEEHQLRNFGRLGDRRRERGGQRDSSDYTIHLTQEISVTGDDRRPRRPDAIV